MSKFVEEKDELKILMYGTARPASTGMEARNTTGSVTGMNL